MGESAEAAVNEAKGDISHVSSRMLFFVSDLLAANQVNLAEVCSGLASFSPDGPQPESITWDDYIELIARLAKVAGGAEGIARSMRSTLATSYSELRALTGFFPNPVQCFLFVTHQLMKEMNPGVATQVTVHSNTAVNVRYRIMDGLRASLLYFQGTHTLLQVFPMHFDLPEAKVTVVSMDERAAEFEVEFPAYGTHWGERRIVASPEQSDVLTAREQEVLELVCRGYTNIEIATALGSATNTVKNQVASILKKMDVANRTELAAHVARRAKV